MSGDNEITKRLKVHVSEDRLQAWVEVLGMQGESFTPPTADEIVEALECSNLAITDDVRKRAEEVAGQVAAAAEEEKKPQENRFLVAEGRPAVDAEDGYFDWAPELAEIFKTPAEGAQVDYFSLNAIVTVDAGTVIGKIVAPVEGTPSEDVFGESRPPRKPKGLVVRPAAGVKFAEEGSADVVAEVAGRVIVEPGKVKVSEILDIPGDVDFNSGSVDACVDVHVSGTVRSNFKVRTTKSLNVDRVIEAAHVDVVGDINVRGGIFGQEQAGRVRAGGTITAQLLNEAVVDSDGDIFVNKEILNCNVHTSGKLICANGTIIGGHVQAREGMELRVIGSDAGVATTIGVGIDAYVLRRVRDMQREVKELEKSAQQIRTAVQPLVANMKRLLPAQREKATELMCKADEIDMKVEDLQSESQQILKEAAPEGEPYVLVNEAVHPGTHLIIGDRQTQFQKTLHGPVKIEIRKVEEVTELAAVNQRTGSVTVLPSVDVDLDALPEPEPAQERNSHGCEQATVDEHQA